MLINSLIISFIILDLLCTKQLLTIATDLVSILINLFLNIPYIYQFHCINSNLFLIINSPNQIFYLNSILNSLISPNIYQNHTILILIQYFLSLVNI